MQHRNHESTSNTSFMVRLLQSPERSYPQTKNASALSITEDIHEFRKLQQELRARGSFGMASANLYMHEAIESQVKEMRHRATINAKPSSAAAEERMPIMEKTPPIVTRRNNLLRSHRRSMSDSDASAFSLAVKSPSSSRQQQSPVSSHRRTSLSMDSDQRDYILSQLQASITETQKKKPSLRFSPTSKNYSSSSSPRSSTNNSSGGGASSFGVTIKERGDPKRTQIFQLGMQ